MRPNAVFSAGARFIVAVWALSTALPVDGWFVAADRPYPLHFAALPPDAGLPSTRTPCGAISDTATCHVPPQSNEREVGEGQGDLQPYDCACVTKSVSERLAGFSGRPSTG
jgi:hypothetical protein